MGGLTRIRGFIAGEPIDHLPAHLLTMPLAARHAGQDYNDYITHGRRLAEAQMPLAEEYGMDCLMQCPSPARELGHIAGDDPSVEWVATGRASGGGAGAGGREARGLHTARARPVRTRADTRPHRVD